ncbi:MAG: LptF/LptG family permease [Candidatus Margulisiibacteriota bacterium]
MNKLIDRYIYKELLYPFIFGVAAFTLILAGGGVLPGLVGEASRFGIPFAQVIRLLIYKLPEMMVYTFPMAMLLSALLAFGRLSGDSEITAFKAGTISLYRLVIPALTIGILVTILTFAFNEYVVPQTSKKSQALKDMTRNTPSTSIRKNVNLTEYEKGYLKRITYAKSLAGSIMKDVAVSEFDQGQFRRVIFANEAIWKQQGGWILFDGIMHQFTIDNPESVFVIKFKEEEINIDVKPAELIEDNQDPKTMNFSELKRFIKLKSRTGADVKELLLEINRKLAVPFASFLFVLLGAPLGLRPQRSSTSIGLGLSILVVFFYYLLTSIGIWLAMTGILSPFTGAWMPNVVTAGIGVYLLRRAIH